MSLDRANTIVEAVATRTAVTPADLWLDTPVFDRTRAA